jgi:hypothetical protein
MTVSSVKTGEVGLSFALNNNFMEPIATTLVGSGGTNNITFNDIPQTYRHLQIRAITQSNRATFSRDEFAIRFNSDVGNNYSWHEIISDGVSMSAQNETSINRILGQDCVGANGWWGNAVIDILDYSKTNKFKTVRFLAGLDTNNSGVSGYNGAIVFTSGNWRNMDSISSISIVPTQGSAWNQYSRFSLYGIKG